MTDRNGREIKSGDIVRISGGYFKRDNGLYLVTNTPGDPSWSGRDLSLKKINRNGSLSTAKYNQAFWPLFVTVSDAWKRAEAKEHNKEHAEIEIVDTVSREGAAEYFKEKAEEAEGMLDFYGWNFGEDSEVYKTTVRLMNHNKEIHERLARA